MRCLSARVNVAIKTMLVALIAVSVAFGSAARFRDKAMGARSIAYPLLCALPFIIWLIAGGSRGRRSYPHAADALITAAFVVDLGGNALDLFDTVTWFDKAAHFTNWLLLGAALGLLLPLALPRWVRAWMIIGFGAATAYLWELAEYQTFVLKIEQVGIYRDTIKDIGSGIGGSCVAAMVVAAHRTRRNSPSPATRTT